MARLLRNPALGNQPGQSVWTAALEMLSLLSQSRGDAGFAWSKLSLAVSFRLRPLLLQVALSTLDGLAAPSQARVDALVDEVADRAKHLTDNMQTAKQKAWRQWVHESLAKGAGAAHKWTNRPNNPWPKIATTAAAEHDPQQVAEAAAASWKQQWQTEAAEQLQQAVRAIAQVRRQALLQQMPRLSPQLLRQALSTFSLGTAVGLDGLEFRMLATMPEQGWTQLTALVSDIVSTVALPTQQLNVLLALLPKKAGVSAL